MISLSDLQNLARKVKWESRRRRRCHDKQTPVYEGAWVGAWFVIIALCMIALGVGFLWGATQ